MAIIAYNYCVCHLSIVGTYYYQHTVHFQYNQLSSLGALSSQCTQSKGKKIVQNILAGAYNNYWGNYMSLFDLYRIFKLGRSASEMAPSCLCPCIEKVRQCEGHLITKFAFKSPAWSREASHNRPHKVINKRATPTAYKPYSDNRYPYFPIVGTCR